MRDYPLARVYRTTEELDTPEVAEVVGTVPEWLQGSFLRSGPGVFDLRSNFQMKHIFDGYAILSKFDIGQNEIKFHKRFLKSEALQRATVSGRPTVCEYGTRGYADPSRGFFARLLPNIVPPLTDNCNLAAYQLGSKVFASTETCHFREVDLKTLESGQKFDSTKLFGVNSMTCHPLTDENGVTFNIGPSLVTGLKYNVIRIPPFTSCDESAAHVLKKSKIIASVSTSWHGLMSFNHSFAMTKNYVIIIEQPYVYIASRVLGGALTKNSCISDWLEWRQDLTNNFLVVEKSTGKIVKTQYSAMTPFFFLHVINAYEDKGHIIIDIFSSPNPSVLNSMAVEALRSGNFREDDLPKGERFVLPMDISDVQDDVNLLSSFKTSAKAVKVGSKIVLTPQVLTLPGLDMPTINRNYLGRKYSYFYATGSVTNGIWRNSIAKIDTRTNQVTIWRKSNSFYVGEALFVSKQNGDEDDGVLLSAVTTDGDDEVGRDFLLILDAKSMEEIGRAYVKCHIPQGVHGTFKFCAPTTLQP